MEGERRCGASTREGPPREGPRARRTHNAAAAAWATAPRIYRARA
eukprot:CAMPEP_0184115286 /NCGR_PEP_ID=MMETSP0974-20121125/19852_1 /TAXON_ID=483370 /ORGANISM="non described non described, Strain CCMP2097" /LENGTH=44 /DNA_ID= /DNA_START= /DNA_END= /DNA_ORIENTATION=